MKHPWLNKYPIDSDSEYLIIGTHPPMPYCGRTEFFYANSNEFWKILQSVYLKDKVLATNECLNLDTIQAFLSKYKISITDIVEETEGTPFYVDANMQPTKLNSRLKEWLENSKIQTILLTSFSGSNSALSLFKKWIHQNYPKTRVIPNHKTWIENGYTITLGDMVYNLELLFSPSPTARRGIHKSTHFLNWKESNPDASVDDFRVFWYASKMPKSML